jgi:hypothetical protein
VPRRSGMRRSAALPAILAAGLLLAGCGGVVLGVASHRGADLRVDDPVTVTVTPAGQVVSGRVVNAGDVTAHSVEVTLTTFVADASGRVVPFQTLLGVPVVNEADGTSRLFPGDAGTFALLVAGSPAIEAVDVEIRARFPAVGDGFFFFLLSPGLVIIIA